MPNRYSAAMAALERIKTGIAKEEPADDPAPPAGPTGPSIPIDPGVTGAGLMRAVGASPWDQPPAPTPPPMPEPGSLLQQLNQFVAQTKTRAAARDYAQRQTVLQAQPLLRQLAAQGRVNAAVDAAQPPAGATSSAVANVIRSYLGPKWARSIWNPSKR